MKWQPMEKEDIPHVNLLADVVHKAHPEDDAIFAERHRLYPAGCYSLIADKALAGYLIAHPWRLGHSPALNTLLGALPQKPDTLYLHDIALAPQARGLRLATAAVVLLIERAVTAGFSSLSLTAVNNSVGFWQKQGFLLASKISEGAASYGEEARSMVYPIIAPLLPTVAR